MDRQQRIFFDLLKYCMSERSEMPASLRGADWQRMYDIAEKQTLLAVVFAGVSRVFGEKASADIPAMPKELMLKWHGRSEQIRRRNMQLNKLAASIYRQLRDAGYQCCVLKGQGNSVMYPNPLVRTPGDIDIWVTGGREVAKEACSTMMEMNASRGAEMEEDVRYYHYEMMIGGVAVELHCFPSLMNNPFYNRRLQRWFERNGDLQCSNLVGLPDGMGEIAVPTVSFNVVYQLSHMYHHFFDEGIGLRQMMDYYFVTLGRDKTADKVVRGELQRLGLYKFAGAVMYVLHEVFGLDGRDMTVEQDERRGRVLMDEISAGGNFGKGFVKYGAFTRQSAAKKYFLKIYRVMHFATLYPAEALCEPVFRTWHWAWRIWQK